MNHLYYLPLEPYVERYTSLMSCVGGWTETHLQRLGVRFTRIDGDVGGLRGGINAGVVLDAFGRSLYAMSQIAAVVRLIAAGVIEDDDVIYTEDFWHPGIESLFYIRDITGVRFRVGCFLHAQSVDCWDFTYPMREWIRPIEVGLSYGFDHIFVCSAILRQLCIDAGYRASSIHLVGLPFNSRRLYQQYPLAADGLSRSPCRVLFSSRFDSEKNPHFYLDLVERRPAVDFVLVNPRAQRPISNDTSVVDRLAKHKPPNLTIVPTTCKRDYYNELQRATIQFNCARQDWVSWTLLEGIAYGCVPLYPRWRDFPVELADFPACLYENESLDDAATKLDYLLETVRTPPAGLSRIVDKHDDSWRRYLIHMGLL